MSVFLCCSLELQPSSRPRLTPPIPSTLAVNGNNSLDWWAAWVATFPPYQRDREARNPEATKSLSPFHETLQLTVYQELGRRAHTRWSPFLGLGASALRAGPPGPPRLPPRLHAWAPRRPERYPLVDPAGLLMLAVPGRSGWWALPESRPAAPVSLPGAAALQPPSSLRGSQAGQVGIGRALPCSPGAQNSFHSGNLSILKFLPGSCKTAAAGNAA